MAAGPVLQALKRLASKMPLSRQARLVRRLLPRSAWFRAALIIARIHGQIVKRMGGNAAFTTEFMLDHWLRELSFGGYFPIPYRVTGLDVCRMPGPKLYTWTHLPLTEVPLRAGLENGCEEPAVVADRGKVIGEDAFLVFGWEKKIEALPADDNLLSRVRTTLRAGKSVVFLADHFLGSPLSEVPLRIAARLKVPVIFQWAELSRDGHIEVTFQYAPYPVSETQEQLEANLEFLRAGNQRVLERLGWRKG